MIIHKNKNYVCHLDLGMDIIKGKWKAIILCKLEDGPKRFLKLHRFVQGVSQKVLTEKLAELEQDGLIFKTIYPEVPPRVEYALTEKGKDLSSALKLIEDWSHKYYSNL